MNARRLLFSMFIGLFVLAGVGQSVQAAPFGYVTDSFEDWVSIIDLANDSFVTTVDVGRGPTGLTVSSDGLRVYVANRVDNSISVIDTLSNTPLAPIPVPGAYPQGVALSLDGSRVYTAYADNGGDWGEFLKSDLAEFDVNTGEKLRDVNLVTNDPTQPFAVKVTPDGSKVLVTDRYTDSVFIVDLEDLEDFPSPAEIPVGANPRGMALSPDSARAYVANEDSSSISVIDILNKKKLTDIDLGGDAPWDTAVSPDNKYVYVSNSKGGDTEINGQVTILDVKTGSMVGNVPVGVMPRGIAVNTSGTRLYVTNYGDNTVSVINTETKSVEDILLNVGDSGIAGGLQDIALSSLGFLSMVNSISFNDLVVGDSSSQTIEVTNRGGTELSIQNMTADLGGNFSLTADTCSGTILNPSESCTFTIVFSPQSAGEVSGSISIPSLAEEPALKKVPVTGFALSATGNRPPVAPLLLSPTNGKTGIGSSVEFRWKLTTDPDRDDLTYQVYYSEDPSLAGAQQSTVVAFVSEHRILLAGGGLASLFGLLVGVPGAIHSRRRLLALLIACAAAALLASACGGGGGGDDATAPPSNTPDEGSVTVSNLKAGTTYYWKVVADDGKDGGQRSSEIWSFTTAD